MILLHGTEAGTISTSLDQALVFICHVLLLPQENTIAPLLSTVTSDNEEKRGGSIRERRKRFSEPAIHSSLVSTVRPAKGMVASSPSGPASSGSPTGLASSGSPTGPASSGSPTGLASSGSPTGLASSGLPPGSGSPVSSCSPPIRRQQQSLPAKLSEEAWSGAGPDRVAAAVQWVDKELRKASTSLLSV